MKKSLAILCLLVVAAIWSVGPAAKTYSYSHATGNPQPVKLHASSHTAPGSIAASAEDLRNLTRAVNCPDGYFDCGGCCVPYACPYGGSGGAQ